MKRGSLVVARKKRKETTPGLDDRLCRLLGTERVSVQVTLSLLARVLCGWSKSGLKNSSSIFGESLKFNFSTKSGISTFSKFVLLNCENRCVFFSLEQSDARSTSLAAKCSWFNELVACKHLLLLQNYCAYFWNSLVPSFLNSVLPMSSPRTSSVLRNSGGAF